MAIVPNTNRIVNAVPIPVAALADTTIPAATRVLLFYMSHAVKNEWVFVKDSSIAGLLGISVETLRRYRSRLKDSGLLESQGAPAGTTGKVIQKHSYRWVVHDLPDLTKAKAALPQYAFVDKDGVAAVAPGKVAAASPAEHRPRKNGTVPPSKHNAAHVPTATSGSYPDKLTRGNIAAFVGEETMVVLASIASPGMAPGIISTLAVNPTIEKLPVPTALARIRSAISECIAKGVTHSTHEVGYEISCLL